MLKFLSNIFKAVRAFFRRSTPKGGLSGTVISVSDGDTVKLSTENGEKIVVRLAEIDTPEKTQPYGPQAKQHLVGLVLNKQVTVNVQAVDRYKRNVGRVYVGKIDVCADMVKTGSAWVYRQYSKDKNLLVLEATARERKAGLWGQPESERIPPWEWRKTNR